MGKLIEQDNKYPSVKKLFYSVPMFDLPFYLTLANFLRSVPSSLNSD